jgi:hypothetical protein
MQGELSTTRKKPVRSVAPEDRLLVGREEAAGMLSISCRALDYLVAKKATLNAKDWLKGVDSHV